MPNSSNSDKPLRINGLANCSLPRPTSDVSQIRPKFFTNSRVISGSFAARSIGNSRVEKSRRRLADQLGYVYTEGPWWTWQDRKEG
jgi:hypothetical protein